MEQLMQIQQQRRSGAGAGDSLEPWKDPLQMLAKQCDTISGEEGAKSGGKRAEGLQQQQQQETMVRGQQHQVVAKTAGKQLQNGTAHLGEVTPKTTLAPQQKSSGGKRSAKTPSKDASSSSPSGAAPPPAFPHPALPNGLFPGFAAPPPAHLASLMMAAGGFFPPPPPPGSAPLPPPPHPSAPRPAPPQHFPPPPSGGPFAGLPNQLLVQQLMAAMQQQQHQMPPGMAVPSMYPNGHAQPGPSMPLPPNMNNGTNPAKKQPEQFEDATAAALAMAMFQGANAFPDPSFLAQNGTAVAPEAPPTSAASGLLPASGLSVPALLMAAACGQLPPGCLACTYRLGGKDQPQRLCGKVFGTDAELFAHYRAAHIGPQSQQQQQQQTSPNLVSSTTSNAASGEHPESASKKNGGSPSSSRSTPTTQQQHQQNGIGTKSHSNPGASMFNGLGWAPPPGAFPPQPLHFMPQAHPSAGRAENGAGGPAASSASAQHGQHRFHPYPPNGKGHPHAHHQQLQQHFGHPAAGQPPHPSLQQQMAMALTNLGLMVPPGAVNPFADLAMLGHHQPPPPPSSSAHHPQPQHSTQLAALAAMIPGTPPGGGSGTAPQQTGTREAAVNG